MVLILLTVLTSEATSQKVWRHAFGVTAAKPAVLYNIKQADTNEYKLFTTDGLGFSIYAMKFFDNKVHGDEHGYHLGFRTGYFAYRNFERGVTNRANTVGIFGGINEEEDVFLNIGGDYHWQERRISSYLSVKGLINESIGNIFPDNSRFQHWTEGIRIGVELKAGALFNTFTDNNPFVEISLSLNTQK